MKSASLLEPIWVMSSRALMPTRYGIGASRTSISSHGRMGISVYAQLIGDMIRARQLVRDDMSVMDELSVTGP